MTVEAARRDPKRLKPHANTRRFFPPLSSQQQSAIAEAADHVPPQILPDGTVLTGADWVDAAANGGLDEIDVIVREDLVENAAEAERLFLLDKLANRDMSDVRFVWCLLRLEEIERGYRFPAGVPVDVRNRIQDEMSERKSIQNRQVNRLIQIAQLPVMVQQAHEFGDVSIKQACQVAALRDAVQHELNRQICSRGIEHAREIINECVTAETSEPQREAKFIRDLNRIAEYRGAEGDLRISSRYLQKIQEVKTILENVERGILDSSAQFDRSLHESVLRLGGNLEDAAVTESSGTLFREADSKA